MSLLAVTLCCALAERPDGYPLLLIAATGADGQLEDAAVVDPEEQT